MRKHALLIGLLAGLGLSGTVSSASGQGRAVDLLVVPGRYTNLQVAFDVLDRRNVVLVSYQIAPGTSDIILHVWDGVEWIPLSPEAYAVFSFTRISPKRIVLVGDEETLPRTLVDAALDSPADRVIELASQDVAVMLNALGSIYRFRSTEWEWFRARYQLDLADANEAARRTSWYDQAQIDRSTAPWNRRKAARAGAEAGRLALPPPVGGEGVASAPTDTDRVEVPDTYAPMDMTSTVINESVVAPRQLDPEIELNPSPLMELETVFEAPIK
jgi:hypothetical protein